MVLRVLACMVVAIPMVASVLSGCGGDSPSSMEVERADARVKRDLVVAYRVANQARVHGLRCSTDRVVACDHPGWYPPLRILLAEVGSAKLNRLKMTMVRSTNGAVDPRLTYLVSDETRRTSITLAQRTRYDTVWVLHGTPSDYRFTRIPDAD